LGRAAKERRIFVGAETDQSELAMFIICHRRYAGFAG
jgi:hypothetical protein